MSRSRSADAPTPRRGALLLVLIGIAFHVASLASIFDVRGSQRRR